MSQPETIAQGLRPENRLEEVTSGGSAMQQVLPRRSIRRTKSRSSINAIGRIPPSAS
jgi:hypothetical protein